MIKNEGNRHIIQTMLSINPRPPEIFFGTRPPKGVVATP